MERLPMMEPFQIIPVGVVRKTDTAVSIEIFDDYSDALLGLDGFSHVVVLFWFDQNDTAKGEGAASRL